MCVEIFTLHSKIFHLGENLRCFSNGKKFFAWKFSLAYQWTINSTAEETSERIFTVFQSNRNSVKHNKKFIQNFLFVLKKNFAFVFERKIGFLSAFSRTKTSTKYTTHTFNPTIYNFSSRKKRFVFIFTIIFSSQRQRNIFTSSFIEGKFSFVTKSAKKTCRKITAAMHFGVLFVGECESLVGSLREKFQQESQTQVTLEVSLNSLKTNLFW